MGSKTLDEGQSSEDGSPVEEPEATDQGDGGGQEESDEAEAAGGDQNTVGKKRKPVRKRKLRKAPEKAKEERTEKGESKRRSVSMEGELLVERPSRERKKVQRYTHVAPRRVSVSKVLSIEQGPGTKLKDIPNVFFKLSKRKAVGNLQVLHRILFGRKSKVQFLKRNISGFSGFVWTGNEEKQRARVKKKLDTCTKDKLLEFCELLDIQIVRAATKKEEIREKLLEFLQSPYVTRDAVLAEKEKGKHKRTDGISQTRTEEASSERETKEKGKVRGDAKVGPSTEEIHAAVCVMTRNWDDDSDVIHMKDVLRRLGDHFNMDLMDRKDEVESIVADVNKKIDDEEEANEKSEEGEDDANEESEGDDDEDGD